MPDLDLCYLPATDAVALFRRRKLSPVELMRAMIARAEAVEPTINAFADTYFDEALAKARKAEARYMGSGGRPRALEGIPVAIKDEMTIKGKRTTSGSLIFKDRIDTETNVLVQRLQRAGAIVHARSTTPEFCAAGICHSRLWGVTRNPWNPDCTTGGSSGGSGASLAAGSATLATGTDIGGSIRIPAACCGVVGFKPPYGRNPETPVFNLDFYSHSGPMARTVADCALMQNVLAGPHPKDIASLKPRKRLPAATGDIEGWRIAYSLDLGYFQLDEDVRQNTLAALDAFRALGATVEEVSFPWTEACQTAAMNYSDHLFGASIARFLADHREVMTDYVIAIAERARGSTADEFLRSLEVAVELYDSVGPMLERHDAFVCPTNAVPAVPAEHDPIGPGFEINGVTVDADFGWIMTHPFNMLSRCPVLSVPSGRASNGVPTGIQIVARTYDDARVFQAATAFERAQPWLDVPERRPEI
ncbi:MAG: amidase [Kiloniellales bacterium]